MIHLTDYLNHETLHPVAPASHDDLLRELLHHCFQKAGETVAPEKLEELVRTHALKDQMLEKGFALSHARLDSLSDIRLSVGLLGKPYRFVRRDRAHTVFCVLIPRDRSREYLAFLARLGRFLQTPGVGDAFKSANVDRILTLLDEPND